MTEQQINSMRDIAIEAITRYQRFMSLRASAAQIARELRTYPGGVDWRGTTKAEMAMAYAKVPFPPRENWEDWDALSEATYKKLLKEFGSKE